MKKLFKCTICGFVSEGDNPPEKCPKCGFESGKFELLDEQTTNNIYAADRTNSIHAEIISLADKIINLSIEGMDENLDPACYKLFEKAKNESWVIKQRSKAEIEGHIKKLKW